MKAANRQITSEDGRVVWDLDDYRFLDEPAADTAHPSLWRQGQLLIRDGLFEVVPGIYQLRGFDLSVMSVIEGADVDAGRIAVIALEGATTSTSCSRRTTGRHGAANAPWSSCRCSATCTPASTIRRCG